MRLITGPDTKPGHKASVILLDGARPDIFDRLARAGDLPNISRHVLEPGGRAEAATVFPSTTLVAYLPFLTGLFPGRTGVPGLRWMDPTRYRGRWFSDRHYVRSYAGIQGGMLERDLGAGSPSIFDLEHDSATYCSPFNRGLAHNRRGCQTVRALLGLQAHYTMLYEPLDRAVCRRMIAEASLGRRFSFAVLPGIDGVAHSKGPEDRRVLELYRAFDRDLGQYLARAGSGPEHLVMLVSDHGFSEVWHHQDLAQALERRGMATMRHPRVWRRNPTAAVMVSGNGAGHIYLAPQRARSARWSISAIESGAVPGVPSDLVWYLASLNGVDLVAATDGGDVVICSSAGRARIRRRLQGIEYAPETADVLGYGGKETHTRDQWLQRSVVQCYPDAPVQLLQLFDTCRTGDLVVSAARGWDLRSEWEIPEHRAGHGSLQSQHMLCLAAINHPVAGPMRTVDTFPMVLNHLGIPVPQGIDGVSRFIRQADPATRGSDGEAA